MDYFFMALLGASMMFLIDIIFLSREYDKLHKHYNNLINQWTNFRKEQIEFYKEKK